MCKGAGWLKKYTNGRDVLGGVALVACDCTDRERQYRVWQRARTASGLSEALFYHTFDNYRADRQPGAYKAARAFCDDPRASWLVLFGEVGTGKTHLAVAIVNALLGSPQWHPVYVVVPEMLRHLKAGFDTGEHTQRWEDIKATEVLVLDDYGTEQRTEWTDATIFELLDYRYARGKATVVTTNLKPSEMPPRIASRLTDRARSRFVVLERGDYRRAGVRAAERGQLPPSAQLDPWDTGEGGDDGEPF